MLKSRLCDYNDSYIRVRETVTTGNTEVADANASNSIIKVIFKKLCIIQKWCQSIYNLIRYSDNY